MAQDQRRKLSTVSPDADPPTVQRSRVSKIILAIISKSEGARSMG
jgi:hypothetical protein